GVERAVRQALERMHQILADAPPTFTGAVDAALACSVYGLPAANRVAASAAPWVSLLRRFGTLEEHASRQRTSATRMLDDLASLRALVAARPQLRDELAAGMVPGDPA